MTEYRRFLEKAGWGGEDSLVEILSASLANTVSWKRGTEKGPAAILEASDALELFDDELLQDTYCIGIHSASPLILENLSSVEACRIIGAEVDRILKNKRFLVLLGGEHTVTLPSVVSCRQYFPDLHVVQIDAHLDLRQQYEEDPLSHACVMRRLFEHGIPFSQVGIRSISREEWQFVKKNLLAPWTMSVIRSDPRWVDKVLDEIHGPVYLTIDVDGLDSSIMPATGTPEPGGLDWWQVTGFIKELAARHRIVGMDCVEFSPLPGAHHASYTAAKLIYRILGYVFQDRLRKNKGKFRTI